jgi:saccharopine dehydrogenase-like NADP-dependent oxidoreductase
VRVLVLGAYGAFGARVAERLAGQPAIELIVAGRSLPRAEAIARRLSEGRGANVIPACMDAADISTDQLARKQANLLINASGPYQRQDYRLARACIAAQVHYVDLADARGFVAGIGTLDEEARRAGVLVVSGASTVPALSAAVIDAYLQQFARLECVRIVISPGNSFDPGLATTQSILGTLGRPFAVPAGGGTATLHGWQGLQRRHIAGLGGRWLGACDTPDLELFPRRYPGLRSVQVFAALEVGAFHLGLWGLSWMVRAGLLRRPEWLAAPLLAVKRAMRVLGSDVGGMAVTLEGASASGGRKRIEWRLIARHGHGPFIPAMPSVILAKRLLAGALTTRGAMPCLGLFTLDEFMAEVADLDITAQAA